MSVIKRISYGLASSLVAMAGLLAIPSANAQIGYGSTLGGVVPGTNMDIGQLFVLDRLFGGNTGGVLGGGQTEYIVQSGDTLRGISQRFLGNSNLYPTIAAANNIPNPNVIYPGQRLVIPAVGAVGGTGVVGGTSNLGDLFVLGRLFNGNQPMNLGDLLVIDQLFSNGAYGSFGTTYGNGVLGGRTGTNLGDLFILSQLFGGSGYGYGGTTVVPVPVVPVVPSTPNNNSNSNNSDNSSNQSPSTDSGDSSSSY